MTLDVKKHGADLDRVADVALAVAEITAKYVPTKKEKDKDPAEWVASVGDMKKAAKDLKAAVKAEDNVAMKKALSSLSGSCSRCHGTFRE